MRKGIKARSGVAGGGTSPPFLSSIFLGHAGIVATVVLVVVFYRCKVADLWFGVKSCSLVSNTTRRRLRLLQDAFGVARVAVGRVAWLGEPRAVSGVVCSWTPW